MIKGMEEVRNRRRCKTDGEEGVERRIEKKRRNKRFRRLI